MCCSLTAIGENKYINGAFKAITASSCALIMYSAYKLGKQVIKGPFAAVLAALSFILVAFIDINAVFVIIGGGILGLIYCLQEIGYGLIPCSGIILRGTRGKA